MAVPPGTPSLWILGGIGIASGFLSALFGVGGGIVVVPLLVLLAAFDSRVATATSLAAILLTTGRMGRADAHKGREKGQYRKLENAHNRVPLG
jgi:uncharacterized membrane protein YfcA